MLAGLQPPEQLIYIYIYMYLYTHTHNEIFILPSLFYRPFQGLIPKPGKRWCLFLPKQCFAVCYWSGSCKM